MGHSVSPPHNCMGQFWHFQFCINASLFAGVKSRNSFLRILLSFFNFLQRNHCIHLSDNPLRGLNMGSLPFLVNVDDSLCPPCHHTELIQWETLSGRDKQEVSDARIIAGFVGGVFGYDDLSLQHALDLLSFELSATEDQAFSLTETCTASSTTSQKPFVCESNRDVMNPCFAEPHNSSSTPLLPSNSPTLEMTQRSKAQGCQTFQEEKPFCSRHPDQKLIRL